MTRTPPTPWHTRTHALTQGLKGTMQDHLDLNFHHEEVSDDQVLGLFPTTVRKKVGHGRDFHGTC